MDVVQVGQQIPLQDNSSADEGRGAGWGYFIEDIEPIARSKATKHSSVLGCAHRPSSQQGWLNVAIQANLRVLFFNFYGRNAFGFCHEGR